MAAAFICCVDGKNVRPIRRRELYPSVLVSQWSNDQEFHDYAYWAPLFFGFGTKKNIHP